MKLLSEFKYFIFPVIIFSSLVNIRAQESDTTLQSNDTFKESFVTVVPYVALGTLDFYIDEKDYGFRPSVEINRKKFSIYLGYDYMYNKTENIAFSRYIRDFTDGYRKSNIYETSFKYKYFLKKKHLKKERFFETEIGYMNVTSKGADFEENKVYGTSFSNIYFLGLNYCAQRYFFDKLVLELNLTYRYQLGSESIENIIYQNISTTKIREFFLRYDLKIGYRFGRVF